MSTSTIEITRKWETTSATVSTLSADNGALRGGYVLERPGPDTTKSGPRLRIPKGLYRLTWHNSNIDSVKPYNPVPLLYNNLVPQGRYILIHNGNYPRDTDGCMPVGALFETEFPLETAIPLLDETFDVVAPEFFRYHEGFALAPARLHVQHLTSFIECGRRLFFGGFTAIAPADTPSPAARAGRAARGPGRGRLRCACALSGVLPARGGRARRADRALASPVVGRLAPGSQVLKLRTVDEAWVEVEIFEEAASPSSPQTAPALRGYLPKRALQVIN